MYAVYGGRSHEMKQTQTHVWSLAGSRGSIVLAGERKGSSSHSGEWRDSGVLSGAMAREVSCTWAVLPAGTEGKHQNCC